MSVPKIILIGTVALFSIIGSLSLFKKSPEQALAQSQSKKIEEVPIRTAVEVVSQKIEPKIVEAEKIAKSDDLPNIDRINNFFTLDPKKRLPIVETITYSSRVPWLRDRPAWISDYASHFATSRHFIARSLNQKPDYFTQKVSPGDRFNVLRTDIDIQFYLLIDLSRCKMWFYYLDNDSNERVLLKTYNVGLGRIESSQSLTPTGKYKLGDKIAIYKPGIMGYFQEQKIEMIRVFGTRWIPFDPYIDKGAKGYGIHGTPWIPDNQTNQLAEDRLRVGTYDSDGCIRLLSEDIEELFSIVITKPTTVEIVNDFYEADLPGVEQMEAAQ